MRNIFKSSTAIALSLALAISGLSMGYNVSSSVVKADSESAADSGFHYIHNPVDNCAAMKNIVVNEDAVYGFSPNPDSGNLTAYASADWTDPEAVEQYRQSRIEYLSDYEKMYDLWEQLESEGETTEDIAKQVSAMRNQIRLDSYADDPEGLETLKARNLETYGNENGPTPEYLYEKYGSWDTVLKKCFSSNAGMDACLGLYDDEYDNYVRLGGVMEHTIVVDDGYGASTESTGLTEGSHCSVCGTILQKQEVIPKLEVTTGEGQTENESASDETTKTESESTSKKAETSTKTTLKSQNIKVIKLRKVKVKSLKTRTIKLNIRAKAYGRLTYKIVQYPKGMKKFITVSKNGLVKLKKKAKSGVYKIRIKANATKTYKSAVKIVKILVA